MGEHGRATLAVVLFAGLALASVVWPLLDHVLTAVLGGVIGLSLGGALGYYVWFRITEAIWNRQVDEECELSHRQNAGKTPEPKVAATEETK